MSDPLTREPSRLLQRQLAPIQALQPGQYTTETMTGDVALACPECGEVSDLDDHVIRPDGTVELLWQCPFACTCSLYLTLEDYAEAVLT